MSSFISDSDALALNQRVHVNRAWFGDFDLPSGMMYLHNGVGTFTYQGRDYLGVTDPLGRLVEIGQVDEPQFGIAASVDITLSGGSGSFLKSLHDLRHDIEGRSANIYWALFDAETEGLLTQLVPVFPFGRMGRPSFSVQGLSVMTIKITIESIWQAKNYPPGGRWNPATQKARYPGDLGLDWVGIEKTDYWQ